MDKTDLVWGFIVTMAREWTVFLWECEGFCELAELCRTMGDTARVTLSWLHTGMDATSQWAMSLLPHGLWLLWEVMAAQV